MPEVHGFVGSPALESIGALLSAPTQPILEVLFTKPSKNACLIDIICSQYTSDWCSAYRIALERISECLKFQVCLGGMPPTQLPYAAPTSSPRQNEIVSYTYVPNCGAYFAHLRLPV